MDGAFSIGSIVAHIKADLTDFQSGLNEAQAEAHSFGDKVGGIADGVRSFAEQAALVVGVQVVAFKELAGEAISVASNFEQTQTSFGTLLGDEQKAADLMKQIMQFEIHTPFDIQTLTNAAKQMLAFGVNAEQVVPIMSELTDMSQGQSEKLNELVSIYGQVNAIQQLNGREVLRLSSIGIPIYQAIEDHFKSIGDTSMSSGEAVKKAIADGTITAQVFNQVIQEMTSKGGLFYQENIRQMSTFNGILSSTKSQIQYAILNIMGIDIGAANEVRKGGLFDTLRTMAANLLDGLNKLQPVLKTIGENRTFQLAIEGLVIALASLVVIIPVVIAILNPIVLVVAGIEVAITALYVAWNTNFLNIQNITGTVVTFVTKNFDTIKKSGEILIGFFGTLFAPAIIASTAQIVIMGAKTLLTAGFMLVQGVVAALAYAAAGWAVAIAWIAANLPLLVIIATVALLGLGIYEVIKHWEDLKKWFGDFFSWLGDKLNDALKAIKNLDPFTRHSPSLVENVQAGVALIKDAYGSLNKLQLGGPSFAGITAGDQSFQSQSSPMYNQIAIDMSGAVISDTTSASNIGETIGDAIIDKLKQNIRF